MLNPASDIGPKGFTKMFATFTFPHFFLSYVEIRLRRDAICAQTEDVF